MVIAKCYFCRLEMTKLEIDLGYRRVLTWSKGRKGGGEHGLVLPELLNEYAHSNCVDMAKRGHLGQKSMF